MSVLLLITEQEVKDMTSLGDNVDPAKFRQWIQVAQDRYIKPAISETCYDALLDAVENDNPTALQTILLDGDDRSFVGLKIALAHWTAFLALPSLWMTIGSSTVQKKTGEGFEAATSKELEIQRDSLKDAASYYTDYLIKYIQCHTDDYTCYSCEGITPLVSDTDVSGISLDYDSIIKVSEEQAIINKGA
jgi:hypothetical protein